MLDTLVAPTVVIPCTRVRLEAKGHGVARGRGVAVATTVSRLVVSDAAKVLIDKVLVDGKMVVEGPLPANAIAPGRAVPLAEVPPEAEVEVHLTNVTKDWLELDVTMLGNEVLPLPEPTTYQYGSSIYNGHVLTGRFSALLRSLGTVRVPVTFAASARTLWLAIADIYLDNPNQVSLRLFVNGKPQMRLEQPVPAELFVTGWLEKLTGAHQSLVVDDRMPGGLVEIELTNRTACDLSVLGRVTAYDTEPPAMLRPMAGQVERVTKALLDPKSPVVQALEKTEAGQHFLTDAKGIVEAARLLATRKWLPVDRVPPHYRLTAHRVLRALVGLPEQPRLADASAVDAFKPFEIAEVEPFEIVEEPVPTALAEVIREFQRDKQIEPLQPLPPASIVPSTDPALSAEAEATAIKNAVAEEEPESGPSDAWLADVPTEAEREKALIFELTSLGLSPDAVGRAVEHVRAKIATSSIATLLEDALVIFADGYVPPAPASAAPPVVEEKRSRPRLGSLLATLREEQPNPAK